MCAPPEDPMNFKRSSLVALAVSLIAVLPARADEWSKTYNLNGKPQLRIETSDANIRITAWDRNTIEAKVITNRYKIGEGGIRVDEHQNGDSVEIDVHYPHHNFNIEWGRHKVDIIVQMPHEGRVNLRTGDGHIDLDMPIATEGQIRQNEVRGKLNGGGSSLTIRTGDGSIHVRKG